MTDIRTYVFEDGYTLQQSTLLRALKLQAEHGMLMTNPRYTGYTSFSKAVIVIFKLGDKTPKTCKSLYKYLKEKGYYDSIEKDDSKRDREEDRDTIQS
jgi:hypothetical protein